VGEHKAIVEAILARDSELATARLRHHISLTTELLLEAGITDESSDSARDEARK
jgi:DNA-binding GntR family transcriptional regulator